MKDNMTDTAFDEELDITAPENALPSLRLEDLPPAMRDACLRASWTRLMPVQAHALPYLMAGRDIMVQSRTGSGKTGAYLLPLLDRLNADHKGVQALILTPTRELASQVEREARLLFDGAGLGVCAVYGGVGYGKQLDALKAGVQVVVGTPGRVLDHLLRRTLSLEDLNVLVFDEADRMLSIGFYPDMKDIQRYLPRRPLLATLFSATYPAHVLNLAGEFLRNPQMLSLSQGQVHVAATPHLYCECRPMDKDRTLVRLLETENPSSAIIFCNTKANVHYITGVLQGFGYNADELSADLSQGRREEVLDKLRRGEVRLLVATDVAARGIDIPDLSHVILYEPPEDRESYIHRAGRTGRAGAVGTVISLVDIMEKLEVERIARFYKIDLIPMTPPSDEDVSRAVAQRTIALLESRRRACTGLQLERVRRFLPLVRELTAGEEEEQLMLLALLLDSDYQQSLGMAPVTLRPVHADTRSRQGRKRRREGGKEHGKEGEGRGERRKRRREGSAEAEDPAQVGAPLEENVSAAQNCGDSAPAGDAPKKRRRRPRRKPSRGEGDGGSIAPPEPSEA